jgi:hypothetical protein
VEGTVQSNIRGNSLIGELVGKSVLQRSSWAELEVLFYQFFWKEEISRYYKSIWVVGKMGSWKCAG